MALNNPKNNLSIVLGGGNVKKVQFVNQSEQFLIISEIGRVSLWEFKSKTLITYKDFLGKCVVFGLEKEEDSIFVAKENSIGVSPNPLKTERFSAFGPENVDKDFYHYINEMFNSRLPTYEERFDYMLITPQRYNMLHLYSFFNMRNHLKLCIKNCIPYVTSKNGISPLKICIMQNFAENIDRIIGYLAKQIRFNPFVLTTVEGYLARLNHLGIGGLSNLYAKGLLKRVSSFTACSAQASLPVVRQTQGSKLDESLFLSAKRYSESEQLIAFYQFGVPMNLEFGSEDSINFVDSIIKCTNSEICNSEVIQFILFYKWQKLKWIPYTKAIIYFHGLTFLSVYSIYRNYYPELLIYLFLVNILFFIFKLFEFSISHTRFYNNIWNVIDILAISMLTLYSMLFWSNSTSHHELIFTLTTVLFWIRGISYFRLFGITRYMVKLIQQVVEDIIPFAILLLYSTLACSLLLFSIEEDKNKFDFPKYLRMAYQLSLNSFDTEHFTTPQ